MAARSPDRLGLPHAHDRGDAVAVGGPRLGRHQRVVLVVVGAAFGVADHHVATAQPGEHRTADVTGMGAGTVRGEILGAVTDGKLVTIDEGLDTAQVGERRQDNDLGVVQFGRLQVESHLLDERDRLEVVQVHLPVARDQRLPPAAARLPAVAGLLVDRHHASRAARPGRTLPSRYSRLAPPPVEI